VRGANLVALDNPLIRLFSGLIFYLLLPVTLMLFAWKAAVFPAWGAALSAVAVTARNKFKSATKRTPMTSNCPFVGKIDDWVGIPSQEGPVRRRGHGFVQAGRACHGARGVRRHATANVRTARMTGNTKMKKPAPQANPQRAALLESERPCRNGVQRPRKHIGASI
jgi:hypothetical protein